MFYFLLQQSDGQKITKYVRNISVKPLCETRWENRIEDIKAVRYLAGKIYYALFEFADCRAK